MFGIITRKEKIQSLEAKIRGLAEENQQLQVERNEQRLRADSYRKACEMIFSSHNETPKSMSCIDIDKCKMHELCFSGVDYDSRDDLPFKINN